MPARPLAFRRGRPTITVQVVKTEKSKCQISIGCLAALGVFAVLVLLSGVRYIPQRPRRRRREALEPRRLGQDAASSRSTARRASSPTSCAVACTISLPLQYRVHKMPLVTIPQGKIGYVFARDGRPLGRRRRSLRTLTARDFQDVRAFLTNGGQRGPQRQILREGTYAHQPRAVPRRDRGQALLPPLSRDEDGSLPPDGHDSSPSAAASRRSSSRAPMTSIGVVTVHDGPSLPQGELIAPVVGDDPRDPDVPQQLPGPGGVPRARAARAVVSSRCSSRARTTSTACSRRSR